MSEWISTPVGILRKPLSNFSNTITVGAGLIGLIIAVSTANQTAFVIKDYAGRVSMQATGSGSLTMSGTLRLGGNACSGFSNGGKLTSDAFGTVSCGNDVSNGTSTGNVISLGDARYVKKQGDTMTGALLVKANLSGSTLIVSGVSSFSGASAYKGALQVKGNLSGETLIVSGVSSFSGASTYKSSLIVKGNLSGETLIVSGKSSMSGALIVRAAISGSSLNITGLKSCTNLQTNVNGALACNSSAYQTTALTDDNVWVGSSSNLAAAGALPSCSNGTTQGLEYNTSTNAFSCVALTGTTYTAGRGLGLASNVFTLNATLTGTTLQKWSIISGSTLIVSGVSSFSGASAYKGALSVKGNLSGETLIVSGKSSMSGALIVRAAISGSSLNITGLKSCTNIQTNVNGALACNASTYQTTSLAEDNVWVGNGSSVATALPSCSNGTTQGLEYNTSTNAFSCVALTGTTYTAGQGLSLASNAFSIGATITGTTLKIYGTATGNIIHAERLMTSSGLLMVQQRVKYQSGALVVQQLRLSTGAYLTSSGSSANSPILVLNSTATTFANAQLMFGTNGTFDIGFYRKSAGLLYMTGSMSGDLLHVEKTLTSSGTITAEGTISGAVLIARVASGQTVRYAYKTPEIIKLTLVASGATVTTGSGKNFYGIPATMSGYKLFNAEAFVGVTGTTNATTVQVRDLGKASRKFFSTPVNVDSTKYSSIGSSTPFVITTANSDVSGGDVLAFDIPAVSTTAPKVLMIYLYFYKP